MKLIVNNLETFIYVPAFGYLIMQEHNLYVGYGSGVHIKYLPFIYKNYLVINKKIYHKYDWKKMYGQRCHVINGVGGAE